MDKIEYKELVSLYPFNYSIISFETLKIKTIFYKVEQKWNDTRLDLRLYFIRLIYIYNS